MTNKVEFVSKNAWAPAAGVGALAFVVGCGIGYFVGVKREKNRIRKIEVEQLSFDFNKAPSKINSDSTTNPEKEPDQTTKTLDGFTKIDVKDFVHVEPDEPEDQTPSEPQKIFRLAKKQTDEDWDYDVEMSNRTADEPYIIHADEYMNQEMENYGQSSLTYFAGDDILVDEQEVPIYNYRTIVGELKFGHGTDGDPNVVFVRNEKLEMEWEILLDQGSYEVEILGLQVEADLSKSDLKHEIPRFRLD